MSVDAPPCGCVIGARGRLVCARHLVLSRCVGNLHGAADPVPKPSPAEKSKNAFKRATPKIAI